MSYYSEKIEKATRYRKEYSEGIDNFLKRKKIEIDENRTKFIDPEKYFQNSEFYRQKFVQMLGFPLTEKREMPILTEKTFVVTDGNVHIYRMQLSFFGGLKFYGLYFEQIENPSEKPFVIGLHGGEGTPELVSSFYQDSANYHHLIRRMTERGASVFVPQLLLWNKTAYEEKYQRAETDGKLRQLGGSITALELYLLRGSIDYFLGNENVNQNKIGVAGLSYGGMYASHLAAIDTRIKACYSCSWVHDTFETAWTDWCYLNARSTFTTSEILALIAPRALIVAMGDKDHLFDYKNTMECCRQAQTYYEKFQKEDLLHCIVFDGAHELDLGEEELDIFFCELGKNKL